MKGQSRPSPPGSEHYDPHAGRKAHADLHANVTTSREHRAKLERERAWAEDLKAQIHSRNARKREDKVHDRESQATSLPGMGERRESVMARATDPLQPARISPVPVHPAVPAWLTAAPPASQLVATSYPQGGAATTYPPMQYMVQPGAANSQPSVYSQPSAYEQPSVYDPNRLHVLPLPSYPVARYAPAGHAAFLILPLGHASPCL